MIEIGTLLFELQELELKGWTSGKTGKHYPCKLFVTGDMKWLLSVCAHKSAGGNHFCYLCTCHKSERANFDLDWQINRKSEDVNTKGKKYRDEKSLFWFVPLERHIPDLLHMMLRICGRFVDYLIREVIDGVPETKWGVHIDSKHPFYDQKTRLQEFADIISNKGKRRTGPAISGFRFYQPRLESGGKGAWQWFGLDRGVPLRTLFQAVYDEDITFQDLIAPGRWARIKTFWAAWWAQFLKINSRTLFTESDAKSWGQETKSIFRKMCTPQAQTPHPNIVSGDWDFAGPDPTSPIIWTNKWEIHGMGRRKRQVRREDGSVLLRADVGPTTIYADDWITPYVHLTVYHVPFFLTKWGTLYWFTCQSLELLNLMHSHLFFKRNTRRKTWMLELLQTTYRVHELRSRGYDFKEYKHRCDYCARKFVYPARFKAHVEQCTTEAADLGLNIVINHSTQWEQCDFF